MTAPLIALALTGCAERDAKSEAPVELTPGLYNVSLGGGGFAQFSGEKEGEQTLCVREADTEALAQQFAMQYFTMHPGCSNRPRAREGNSFGGTMTCSVDPQRAQGSWVIDYEGTIAAEAVDITGRMTIELTPTPGTMSAEEEAQLKMGTKFMENIPLIVSAKRTGDCT